MSDAPASTEALDAAAAAATSGAVPPAAPPPSEPPVPASGDGSEGAPSLQAAVEDESVDIDTLDLPDATKEELRTLRKQTKKYREQATPWVSATRGWNDSDLDMLRTALEAGPSNPEAVGEWMLNSAKALLGDRFSELTAAEAAEIPDVGEVDDETGKTLTAADVERLVAEKIAEREQEATSKATLEAQIRAVVDKTTELGFGPGSTLHFALLSIAKTQTNGNLDEAAELLRQELGQGESPASLDAPDESGHTPVPPEGGTPAGTKRPSSPRAAAEERISALIGNARGFQ